MTNKNGDKGITQSEIRKKYKVYAIDYFGFLLRQGVKLYTWRDILPCEIDVNNFVLCGFGVVLLQYLTLRRRTLSHIRVPNSAKYTRVEYKVPPRCVWLLCFLCMLIIHASSDLCPPNQNTPNGDPHNPSSNNQHLATKCPIPNVIQADVTGSACGSPSTAAFPPDHVTLTQHGFSPRLKF